MEAYTSFAAVYDTFMDQEPYEDWADNVCALLEKYGLPRKPSGEENIVVDLGCGTGRLTELLAARGYDMIGIDLSEDMLAIAQERKTASGFDILYSMQDMREFELYGAAGAMVSVGDSINYLLEEADLEQMFRCVERALLPGGVFVFDFKTVHLYRDVIGSRTIAEDRGDCAFIWENEYDPENCINEYALAVFVLTEKPGGRDSVMTEKPGGGQLPEDDLPAASQDPEDGGEEEMPSFDGCLYRRFEEIHLQRGYTIEQLCRAAEAAGLVWAAQQDAETGGPVTDETERALSVVRKP